MATTGKTEKRDDHTGGGAPQPSSPQASNALTRTENKPAALARPLGTFGPFSLMRDLLRSLERLTGLGAPDRQRRGDLERGPDRGLGVLTFTPTVEIMHRDGKLIVNVDLPGLSASDVRVTVEEGALIVEGERRSEHEELADHVWHCERLYGRFQRVIPLPAGADLASAEARFESGVLEISLRAPEQQRRGRRVEIKTSSAQPDKAQQATSH